MADEKRRKRRISVFDLLPETPEVAEAVDRLGYGLLADAGYEVDVLTTDEREIQERNSAISAALCARREQLVICAAVDIGKRGIMVWFELRKRKKMLSRSRALQLLESRGEKKT